MQLSRMGSMFLVYVFVHITVVSYNFPVGVCDSVKIFYRGK